MNIKIKDVVILENNEQYAVASNAIYNNTNYYYLISMKNNEDILICYLNQDEFITVTKPDLINNLLPLFYNNSKDLIPKDN